MKIIESKELEFKSYHDFLVYIKKNNLSWRDKGPFKVYLDKQPTIFNTVGDVLERYEEEHKWWR